MKPVIYIAGPYSHADPCGATNTAIKFADTLMDSGRCWPLVPHRSHLWHTVCPRPYQDWLDLDIALLRRCDGIIRIAGESSGADGELDVAREIGMPILNDVVVDSLWAPRVMAWLDAQFGGAA